MSLFDLSLEVAKLFAQSSMTGRVIVSDVNLDECWWKLGQQLGASAELVTNTG
jgi:hypothetical protein